MHSVVYSLLLLLLSFNCFRGISGANFLLRLRFSVFGTFGGPNEKFALPTPLDRWCNYYLPELLRIAVLPHLTLSMS